MLARLLVQYEFYVVVVFLSVHAISVFQASPLKSTLMCLDEKCSPMPFQSNSGGKLTKLSISMQYSPPARLLPVRGCAMGTLAILLAA